MSKQQEPQLFPNDAERERRVKGRGKRKKRGPKLCEVWSGQKVAGTKVEGRGRKRRSVGGVNLWEPNV